MRRSLWACSDWWGTSSCTTRAVLYSTEAPDPLYRAAITRRRRLTGRPSMWCHPLKAWNKSLRSIIQLTSLGWNIEPCFKFCLFWAAGRAEFPLWHSVCWKPPGLFQPVICNFCTNCHTFRSSSYAALKAGARRCLVCFTVLVGTGECRCGIRNLQAVYPTISESDRKGLEWQGSARAKSKVEGCWREKSCHVTCWRAII